ncbi:MAG: hypothetical protein JSU59_01975, partial [Nitrospirota bacterium]
MPFFQRTVETVVKRFGGIRLPFSVITAGLPFARLWVQHANGAVCHFPLKIPSSTIPSISVQIVDSTHRHLLEPGHSILTNLP